ncbi:MAG: CHASE3 domain-containing protein, partial [Janthinobacterium lividum]
MANLDEPRRHMMSVQAKNADVGWWRWAPWLAGAVLTVSLIIAGVAYLLDRSHARADGRDNATILATERLLSAMRDVETGERGFIITRREDYLEPYRSGLASVPPDEAVLAALIGAGAGDLSRLVSDRLAEAADGIETYRRQGAAAGAASIESGRGKALMDQVRVEVAHLQSDARTRIDATAAEQRRDDLLRIASVVGLLASCVVLALLAILRRRQHEASQELFEGVLENAPIGVGILDPSLRILHVNSALSKMSERALSAAPGMSIWDVLPDL